MEALQASALPLGYATKKSNDLHYAKNRLRGQIKKYIEKGIRIIKIAQLRQ